MKTYAVISGLVVLLLCFFINSNFNSTNKKRVVNFNDYEKYLTLNENLKLENIKTEIDFWEKKYSYSPNQYTYLIKLASLNSQLFDITGNVNNLYTAENLLLDCNSRVNGKSASIHRSIAKNYISQHRFKDALLHLESALYLGENKLNTEKMLFDVQPRGNASGLQRRQHRFHHPDADRRHGALQLPVDQKHGQLRDDQGHHGPDRRHLRRYGNRRGNMRFHFRVHHHAAARAYGYA